MVNIDIVKYERKVVSRKTNITLSLMLLGPVEKVTITYDKTEEKKIDINNNDKLTIELLEKNGIEINKNLVMIGFEYNDSKSKKDNDNCIYPSKIVLLYDNMGARGFVRNIRRVVHSRKKRRQFGKIIDKIFEEQKYKPKIEEINTKVKFNTTFIETRDKHIFKYIMAYNISGIKKILSKNFKEVDFASCKVNSNNNKSGGGKRISKKSAKTKINKRISKKRQVTFITNKKNKRKATFIVNNKKINKKRKATFRKSSGKRNSETKKDGLFSLFGF